MVRNGQDIRLLPDDAILTPSARDFLRDLETNGESQSGRRECAQLRAATASRSRLPSR